jgi:hypothetical protein
MNNDLERTAAERVSPSELDKIKQIASTEEGRQIRQMMNSKDIQKAAEKGDMDSLKNAVTNLLKTDAGAKLADRIAEMMNNK